MINMTVLQDADQRSLEVLSVSCLSRTSGLKSHHRLMTTLHRRKTLPSAFWLQQLVPLAAVRAGCVRPFANRWGYLLSALGGLRRWSVRDLFGARGMGWLSRYGLGNS